jgi:hypothetical protein
MPRGQHPNSRKNLIPPAKPGEVRNPKGRTTAGASIREYMNAMAEAELTETELRTIARSKVQPWTRRAAAERILRTLETGDVADFLPVVEGKKTLKELRDEGINTEVVKKIKPSEHGVEIELHDRAGADVDRIMDRTDGRPKQTVDVNNTTTITHTDARDQVAALAAAVRERLGLNRN